MEDEYSSRMQFKNNINELFTKSKKYRPQTRVELMKKIKNIILLNSNLNHHVEIDFDFRKEYKEMNKTMKKFNTNHFIKKNIINELSKENQFFSKSYSNMISSLITKIERKNINYQTLSDFNTKYVKHNSKQKEKNFFYQNPLLLTKNKDMINFYLYGKTKDEDNDQYLNYSKKLLSKINKESPPLKIKNIINDYNTKTIYRMNMEKRRSQRINMFNTFYDNKSLTERNTDKNRSKTLRINKNFFKEKIKDLNDGQKKTIEIKIFNKYNKDTSKDIANSDTKQEKRKDSQEKYKDIDIMKEPKIKSENKKRKKSLDKKVLEFIPLTDRNSKRNSDQKLINKLYSLGIEPTEINNIKEKILTMKTKKTKKFKGSIQIKNIYDDYMQTKKIIDDYQKENSIKLKYLYYSSGNKKLKPFHRNEIENSKINKLGYNLFWNINKQ